MDEPTTTTTATRSVAFFVCAKRHVFSWGDEDWHAGASQAGLDYLAPMYCPVDDPAPCMDSSHLVQFDTKPAAEHYAREAKVVGMRIDYDPASPERLIRLLDAYGGLDFWKDTILAARYGADPTRDAFESMSDDERADVLAVVTRLRR